MKFRDGIDAQPQVLIQSAASVKEQLKAIAPLPAQSSVALVGIGASEHIALGAAAAWREQGLRAIAQPATDFLAAPAVIADTYVLISESGRSKETLLALEHLSERRTIAVTNFVDSPIAQGCRESISVDSGPDSPVYTTGFTSSLQAVGLLGEHWSGQPTDWSELPSQVADVLSQAATVLQPLAQSFDEARIIDFVGTHTALAAAGEGALMMRESARARTAFHELQNYLHGPMEPIDSASACVVVGSGRALKLAEDLMRIGATTLLISDVETTVPQVQLPATRSLMARAVLEILPIQVLARTLADRRGLQVDGFRYRQQDTKVGEILMRASDAID